MIQKVISPEDKGNNILSNLHHKISLICRGNILVFSKQNNYNSLNDTIIKRYSSARSIDFSSFDKLESFKSSSNIYKTVVLLSESNNIKEDELAHSISVAWKLLLDKGRLIICVPNQESIERNLRMDYLKLRNLKKRIKHLGKIKIVREQPYKWLLMHITKKDKDDMEIDDSNRARIDITSKLCHGKVIELGCGRGHLTKAIYDLGLNVTGVDISERKIAVARELYPDINFMQADIFKLEFPDYIFDTVVLAEVLEHFPESTTDSILTISQKLLKRGGRLIVSVPNEDSIMHHNHLRIFNRASLKKILSSYGNPRLVSDQPYKWLMMYVDQRNSKY